MSTERDQDWDFGGLALGCVGIVLLLPPLLAFYGFVASKLWLWYVAGPFDVVVISWAHWVGLFGLKSIVFGRYENAKEDKADRFVDMITRPLLALAIGWIFKGFM